MVIKCDPVGPDLYGITIENYSMSASPSDHDNIDKVVDKISRQMQTSDETRFSWYASFYRARDRIFQQLR